MISKEIDEQIKFFYNKSFNDMNDLEKQEITDITLNHKDFRGNNTDTKIYELLQLPNLKTCTINAFNITEEDIRDIKKCKNLKSIQFSNCNFINIKISLRNLETLIIDNCKGNIEKLFSNLGELNFLQIVSNEMFDVSYIEKCQSLEQLYIQDTTIKDLKKLKDFTKLEYLNLNQSKFNKFSFEILKRNSKFEIDYDKNAMIKVG